MARPSSPPPASGPAAVKQSKSLWRPRSIGNLLGTTKSTTAPVKQLSPSPSPSRSPASVPLPLSPPLSSDASLPSLYSPPLAVPFAASQSNVGQLDASNSGGMRADKQPPSSPQSDPTVRYSLALLDGALQELDGLASPRISVVPEAEGLGFGTVSASDEDEEGEMTLDLGAHDLSLEQNQERTPRTRSMAFYQLSVDSDSAAEREGKGLDFGQNMLWDALGLEPETEEAEEEDASSLAYAQSHSSVSGHSHSTSVESSIHDRPGVELGANGSIGSIPSIHPPSSVPSKTRELSNPTSSGSGGSSSDEFDISELPSYSDLTAFAAVTPPAPAELLEFPVPPAAGGFPFPSSSGQEQSEMSREEAAIFERLDALGSPGAGRHDQGLGLYDYSAPSTPGLLGLGLGLGLDFPQAPIQGRTSEDGSASTSGHSSTTATTTSRSGSSTSHTFSSADTSAEAATYHLASSHRLSALPPPPPLRAKASVQSLPEIFRTHPSPEGRVVVNLSPAPLATPEEEGLRSPLRLDTGFAAQQEQEHRPRSASPLDYGYSYGPSSFGGYQQQYYQQQEERHFLPSPPAPSSPGVFVASMQPRDSFAAFSPSSNDGPFPSFSPSSPADDSRPSSRANSPTSSPARRAIRYMASTDSLGLEGDNGMPLWSAAPAELEELERKDEARSRSRSNSTSSGSKQERPSLQLLPQQLSTKGAASAPRSPLATAAPVFPSSPPPASSATLGAVSAAAARPLSGMTKRLSFMNLRKRRSEAVLSTSAAGTGTKGTPSPLVLPATTTPAKLARRSVSSPRLSTFAKQQEKEQTRPPLPTSPTLISFVRPATARRQSIGAEEVLKEKVKEKENVAPPRTATRSKSQRFSAFMFGTRSSFKEAPASIVVPPVPSLPTARDATPMSAPPTTTTFALTQLLPPAAPASSTPSVASSSRDDTPSLSSNDDHSLSADTSASPSIPPTPSTPFASSPRTPNGLQHQPQQTGFFDYATLGANELQYSPCTLAELGGAGLGLQHWRDATPTEERSGASTPILAGMSSPRFGFGDAKEQQHEEQKEELELDLKDFLKGDSKEKSLRPVRSSSFFSTAKSIFPSRSTSALNDSTNVDKTKGAGAEVEMKRSMSPLPFDQPIVVPDVVAFPLRVDSHSPRIATSQEEEDMSSSSDADAEGEDEIEEPRRDSSDSDDKPLGVIPGALKMQKSLRQESRKARTSSRPVKPTTPSPKIDPFEFDKLVDVNRTPSTSAAAAPGESVGHSLLPQTDEAVERRSSPLTRSPSSPLDPLVANSALTIDSPVVTHRPLAPARSSTLPISSSASSSREPSPRRPSLGVHTSGAAFSTVPAPLRSPGLAPPRPTGRLPPTPSGPPSRRPSQSQEASTIHRQRSNTALSSSSRPTEMQRGLSARSNGSSQGRDTSPTTSPRIPAATVPSLPTVEHRIFVGDHSKRILFSVSASTTAAEVVAHAKAKGALTEGTDLEGGWALWEICRSLGVERPIREYELVSDVVKSWDHDSNILIIRRTTLWPLLSSHLRPQPAVPRSAFVQLEVKKGKWSKRYLELKDGVVSHAKSEKLKDATTLCTLSSFEFFFIGAHVVDSLKAPKPFVFALKSKLPRAHYENQEDYCYFLSVKAVTELNDWAKALIEARNVFARQQGSASLNPSPSISRPHLSSASHTPAPSPPLSRAPTLRPAPAVLAIPSRSAAADGGLKSPPSAGAMSKPDARAWAAMSEGDRQTWLKEAQREAREKGKTLLDFGGEQR